MNLAEINRRLRQPALWAAGFFLGSLIQFQGLNAIAVAASVGTFAAMAVQSVGTRYVELTQQSPIVKHGFGMIANPLGTAVPLLTFFYLVFAGPIPWLFIGIALFVALIFFALDFTSFVQALNGGSADE